MSTKPHYELETMPSITWPRLYAVDETGERHKVDRRAWGHCIADAIGYARSGGYTDVRGRVVDGLMVFYLPTEEGLVSV